MNTIDNYIQSQEDNIPLGEINDSSSEEYIDVSQLLSDEVFIGDTPFDTIISAITEQFNDYINMEDKTNYVDIFYSQLEESYAAVNEDDTTFSIEMREALDNINDQFIDIMQGLFKIRVAINILDENDIPDDETIEYRMRNAYKFFIINARENFKIAITKDMIPRLNISLDDREFYAMIDDLLDINYTPLITGITPEQFIEYIGDDDMIDMYRDGDITGNFFRKYTAKLYQNDEFRCEIISNIILNCQFGKELQNQNE